MKFFIFLSVVALVAFSPSLVLGDNTRRRISNPESLIPTGTALMKAKAISASGFTQNADDVDQMCSISCLGMLNEAFSEDLEMNTYAEDNALPYRFNDRFKPELLRKMCSKVNQTIDCIRPCPAAMFKDIVEAVFLLYRYVCIDSTFMNHAQCFYNVNSGWKTSCDSKCSRKKENLQSAMSGRPATMTEVQTMLDGMCQYMDCDSKCDQKAISNDCGTQAGTVYQGYYKKSIDSAKGVFRATGIEVEMPAACNSVGVIEPDDDD